MGRKHEPNPRLPKTISMPEYVWNIVDSRSNNRSRYIERAIKVYDDGTDPSDYDIEIMTTYQIAGKLFRRLRNTLGHEHELTMQMFDVYQDIQTEEIQANFGGNQ